MADPIRKKGSRTTHPSDVVASRCFGLRIESHLLQVAIATPIGNDRYKITIDSLACPEPDGWLNWDGRFALVEAFETLVDRHGMQRHPIAVSLDGDFCVTRVTIGTASEVDHELTMLADRIPRYLQLGPGEKVTGSARRKIDATTDYAVTGVVNRSLIQLIYDSLRNADIEVMWVEPSLVGIARLVGEPTLWGDQPIMIADGTGKQWDVGIASSGRLLLDYRPASANSEQGLRDALDGHITRLKRFCHRHLRGVSGELKEMLICGDGTRPQLAVDAIGHDFDLQPKTLRVPELPNIFEISDEDRQSSCVPAVATVFPLLTRVQASDVPDLLVQVRRAPDLSWPQQAAKMLWPVAVASICMITSYGLVSKERRRHAGTKQGRTELQSQIVASNIKFSQLARKREQLDHFKLIEKQTTEPDWSEMLTNVTQSLPEMAKLNEFRIESGGQVLMDGTVIEESIVYEVVNTLRRLPGVTQVALKGTTPEQDTQSTRFAIRLTTKQAERPSQIGIDDE
ncbi:GerMN domain-containing protein [Rubripirellula reticaptiva]|nr:GerMN domain-containing protein [Rubripirellula reticaptiva]